MILISSLQKLCFFCLFVCLCSIKIILSLHFWGEHAENVSKVGTNVDKLWRKEQNGKKKTANEKLRTKTVRTVPFVQKL